MILAAGASSRMHREKMLIPVGGKSLLQWIVDAAILSNLTEIVVVIKPSLCHLPNLCSIQKPRLKWVVNEAPELGMSSSIRLGIEKVSADSAGALVILGDQPLLNPGTINKLISVFAENTQQIVAPLVNRFRTTPVLFPRFLFDELRSIKGDQGGRSLIEKHRNAMTLVDCSADYNDLDLDSPTDLQEFYKLVTP